MVLYCGLRQHLKEDPVPKKKSTVKVHSSAKAPKSSKPTYTCLVNLFDKENSFEYKPRKVYEEDEFILGFVDTPHDYFRKRG